MRKKKTRICTITVNGKVNMEKMYNKIFDALDE